MGFVVEITSRSGRIIERYRMEGDRVRIGRGYDNDIIVSDPYVNAHHVLIEASEGRWHVYAVSGADGVMVNGRKLAEAGASLESGGRIDFGRTHLAVYAPDHPVAPVLAFDRIEQVFATLATPAGVVWSVLAFAGFLLGDLFLRDYHELEVASVLQDLSGYFGLSMLWAAFWSVVGRISRGEPRFFHHWLVAVAAILTDAAGQFGIEVVAFNTASVEVKEILAQLLNGACLAFALTLNLRFALRQSLIARHAWAQGFAWAVIGYGVLTSLQFEAFFAGAPEYDGTVLPEMWRFTQAVPAESFIEQSASLYDFPPEEAEESATPEVPVEPEAAIESGTPEQVEVPEASA